jgi:SAM-dependent methyltransferase
MNDAQCPVCHAEGGHGFFQSSAVPVTIGVQWPSQEAARDCAKGDIRLVCCPGCGFIWNSVFDAGRLDYSVAYDNSLDHSEVFRSYARALAERLIRTYDVRHKRVLELGCGKGRFLALLCEWGDNHGVGFDPSFDIHQVESPARHRMSAVQDYYGPRYSGYHGDLICCRHVLEHIPHPAEFIQTVRCTVEDQLSTVLYFEVPNVRFILEQQSIWDIIYEHCNYFGCESLEYLFHHNGFEILRSEPDYNHQFLTLDARPSSSNKATGGADTEAILNATERFAEAVRSRLDHWHTRLADWRRRHRRAVIWGAGAKAVSFLNMLNVLGEIPYVVDLNPNKQGKFIAGTAQQIVPPEFLRTYQPEAVVLMNAIYRREVEKHLKQLGLSPELITA